MLFRFHSTLKDFIIKAAANYEVTNDKEEMMEMAVEEPTEKWDCETILSKRRFIKLEAFKMAMP
jgi:hypothetical protein